MSAIRQILAGLLSLVLAATGGTLATARGQAMVAGQIVICSGGAAVTVSVDAQGRPVGPVHICPDCALSLFDAAAAVPVLPVRPAAVGQVRFRAAESRNVSRSAPPAQARDPPVT